MTRHVAVDVIVATRNRPGDLANLLTSLREQSHVDYRCMIVDQSDSARSVKSMIDGLGDDRFVYVPNPEVGKSRALNLGLRMSDSDVVAFTDDDCIVPSEWIARIVDAIETTPNIGFVFGNVTAFPHDPSVEFVPSIAFEALRTIDGRPLRPIGLIGMGANMAARRDVFDSIGGFDEDLGPGGRLRTGEDCEIAYRALRHGFVVLQSPELDVVHYGARPVADHVARDMVTTGWFAIGAGYGKHLRSGDWRALVVVAGEVFAGFSALAAAVLRRRGPFHVRRLIEFGRGVGRGVAAGPSLGSAGNADG